MTHTNVRENPDKTEFFIDHILVCVDVSEHKVTGRGYDKKRDEYHESTRELNSEEKFIKCPLITMTNKKTGEEVGDDVVDSMMDEGPRDMRRTDYDEIEYDYDGETYVGVYDMSDMPTEQ